MMKDRGKHYQVFHAILSMMLTFALVSAMNYYYVLQVHILICALFSCVLTVLVNLFDNNRKKILTYLIIFSLFLIFAFVILFGKINLWSIIGKLIDWCKKYNGSEELYIANYAYLVIFVASFLGSILFYFIMKKKITKIGLAILILAVLIILSVKSIEMSKITIGVCLFYILTIIVEMYGILFVKKGSGQEKRGAILYLSPICLLIAVLSVSMPSKPEPIQWTGVKSILNELKDKFNYIITEIEYFFDKNNSEFNISYSGYSEESKELGGNVVGIGKTVLKIQAGTKSTSAGYLIGSVSDVYTGTRWDKSKLDSIEGKEEYFLDYAELVCGLSRVDASIIDEDQLIRRRNIEITYQNIKTKTLFYPLKSSRIDFYKKKKEPNKTYANIKFNSAVGMNTNYKCFYYEMNLRGEVFQSVLREQSRFSYKENKNALDQEAIRLVEKKLFFFDNIDSIRYTGNLYELLRKRAEMIRKQYTVLPDTLPTRVNELAVAITENYDNTYDKLKAIEEFLHTYKYTISPGEVPEGEDFVDYFLFERKEGYCTSFATSMAILARCVGIPTRYVEGFTVNYKEREGMSTYIVKSSQAHAWAEAYIEGIGWIPFEATPTYFNQRYVAWKDKIYPAPASVGSGYDTNSNQDRLEELLNKEGNVIIPLGKSGNSFIKLLFGIVIFIATIILVVLLLTVYYSLLKSKYRKAFIKADDSHKMYMLFVQILRYFEQDGFELSPNETILILAKRVNHIYCAKEITFLEIADIFMRFRYAETPVTNKELVQITTFHRGLEEKLRLEKGKLRMLLDHFLFLTKMGSY